MRQEGGRRVGGGGQEGTSKAQGGRGKGGGEARRKQKMASISFRRRVNPKGTADLLILELESCKFV